MKKHLAIALAAAMLVPLAAEAASRPAAGPYDPRVKTVPYNDQDVVVIVGHYGFSTNIEFAAGETIHSIALGDSLAWEVSPRGNHLFVKPREDNATTNMTVITNARSYQFWLDAAQASNKGRGAEMFFRVKFEYPREEAARAQAEADRRAAAAALAESIPATNYNYWGCGNPRLLPTEAYDDGRFTYLRFPGSQEIPAAFVINSDGQETLASGTMRGDQLVLQTTAAKIILRKGKAVACLENRSHNWYGIYNTTGTTSPGVRRSVRGDAIQEAPTLPVVPQDGPPPPRAPGAITLPDVPFQIPLPGAGAQPETNND